MNITTIQADLIAYVLQKTDRQVELETNLAEEEVFDSMGFVELLAHTEASYKIQFNAEELDHVFNCIADLSKAIADKVS